MRYYMAPLEEVTGYVFRNAYHAFFYPMDKYFAPFIAAKPNHGRLFNYKEKNDILPEHNEGIYLVPQILTNNSEDFIRTAKGLWEYGYREVNLNLGCPSKPVVNGKRGAGFLGEKERLDHFLYKIYEEVDMKISIKTRLGRYEPDEIEELMDIYNKYPLEELVIHPRVRDDYYMGEPRLESFSKAYAKRTCPICYNGDIFVEEDYNKIERRFPMIAGVMMGRGILADPGLLGRIHGEEEPAIEIWRGFHQKLYDDFRRISVNEEKALFKMKEIWCYLKYSFPKYDVWNKGIKKAQDLKEYEKTVKELFDNYPETPGGRYRGWHQNHPKQIRVQREKNMQMENWEALYQKALRIAAGAHEGQVDKGGHPYIGHPLAVAQKVNGIEEKIAALLHDVVEDTEVTIEELGREFPEEIVKAVDLLTKKKEPGFSQQKYLEAIRANPLARNVKLADLEHNMDINRIPHPGAEDYLRTKRYQNSRDFLTRKYD